MIDMLIEWFWDAVWALNFWVEVLASWLGLEGEIAWPIYIGLAALVVLVFGLITSETFLIYGFFLLVIVGIVSLIWEKVSGWIGW